MTYGTPPIIDSSVYHTSNSASMIDITSRVRGYIRNGLRFIWSLANRCPIFCKTGKRNYTVCGVIRLCFLPCTFGVVSGALVFLAYDFNQAEEIINE